MLAAAAEHVAAALDPSWISQLIVTAGSVIVGILALRANARGKKVEQEQNSRANRLQERSQEWDQLRETLEDLRVQKAGLIQDYDRERTRRQAAEGQLHTVEDKYEAFREESRDRMDKAHRLAQTLYTQVTDEIAREAAQQTGEEINLPLETGLDVRRDGDDITPLLDALDPPDDQSDEGDAPPEPESPEDPHE